MEETEDRDPAEDGFNDGDVVKWRVGKKYTFAALLVAAVGKWYVTGGAGVYPASMTHQEFSDRLEYADVSDIVVCQSWEPVEG
jgi:hypothetical protein